MESPDFAAMGMLRAARRDGLEAVSGAQSECTNYAIAQQTRNFRGDAGRHQLILQNIAHKQCVPLK
jgi:hypothetical protein